MWYRPVRERPGGRGPRAWPATSWPQTGHQELAFASLSTTDYSVSRGGVDRGRRRSPRGEPLPAVLAGGHRVGAAGLACVAHGRLPDARAGGRQPAHARHRQQERHRGRRVDGGRGGLQDGADDAQALLHDRSSLGDRRRCGRHRRSVPEGAAGRAADSWRPGGQAPAERERQHLHPQAVHAVPVGGHGRSGDATPPPGAAAGRVCGSRASVWPCPDPGKSYLEAALARGGEEMGAVIEAAWKKGARFDSWTEQFQAGGLGRGVQGGGDVGGSIGDHAALAGPGRSRGTWSKGCPTATSCGPSGRRPSRGELTGDCRWDGCDDCGACAEPPGNDLAAGAPAAPCARRQLPRCEAAELGCRRPSQRGARRARRLGATSPASRSRAGAAFWAIWTAWKPSAGPSAGPADAWLFPPACGPSRCSVSPSPWGWGSKVWRSSASSSWPRSPAQVSPSGWRRLCPGICGCSTCSPTRKRAGWPPG